MESRFPSGPIAPKMGQQEAPMRILPYLRRGFALACLAGLGYATVPGAAARLLPGVELAANARNPYGNVDPRNDAGNDTGDSQVEQLNEGQLDGNYRGPYRPMPPRGYAGPPQAYAAPPPGYAPPPPYPRPPRIYGAPPPGYPAPPPGYAAPPQIYGAPPQYYRPPGT